MKKLILTLLTLIVTVNTINAQPFNNKIHLKNVYKNIETYTLDKAPVIYPTEDSTYLVELPRESKIIVAFNEDKTKAIMLHSGYMFGRRMEFNVKDNETRLILYHKDNHLYCGYIYDKKEKAGKYFEAINEDEKNKLIKKLPFLRKMPTFTNAENPNIYD